jgi:hypothetical protein
MISAEEKTAVAVDDSTGDRNTYGETVEVISVFITQRKIFAFVSKFFEVKIHLKRFSFKK